MSYDVAEDTCVYIYAIIGSSNARMTRAASTDVVKIYGITVTPGATGISYIVSPSQTSGSHYTLDGQQLQGQPAKKGIYITKGRKVVVK